MATSHSNRFTYSGKNSPCPVCSRTKDKDCHWNSEIVLCHSHIEQDAQIADYIYRGATKEGLWGQYFRSHEQHKPIRARNKKEYFYPTRDGNPLLKVTRSDDGLGHKHFYQAHWDGMQWISGCPKEIRHLIPIYRYQEVIEAIANGQTIFWVEGEGVADDLWKLGIPATTSIGGSKGYNSYGTYHQDLAAASVVICSDRDREGLAYAEQVAQNFPHAQWCYVFPDSPLWSRLPLNGGLDASDWIKDGATIEDFFAAVGEKRILETHTPQSSKVIEHPTVDRVILNDDQIESRINTLIASGLSTTKLHLALATLAKEANRSERTIWETYRLKLAEIEQTESREDVVADLEKLLNASNTSIDITQILPATLANPIAQLASWLNLRPEAYLTTLITTVSSLNKVGTFIEVCSSVDWCEPPQLYSGIVAVSSQKKSPILKAIATKPFKQFQREIKQNFNANMKEYGERIAQWDNCEPQNRAANFPDGKPEKPKLRHLSFTQGTTEGLFRQLQNHSDKGILWNCDELAALFKGANQYKAGKGDDTEQLLSMYDGGGISLLRADESKNIDIEGCILSIMGTIQPSVLQRLMKDDEDGNGQWARFCWVNQPLAESHLPESGSIELTPLLSSLYEKIDNLTPQIYKLSKEAWILFHQEYKRLESKRIQSANQSTGLSSCYGKAEGRMARLALNLHLIWEVMSGNTPNEFISIDVLRKAISLNRFYLAQVVSMYSEFHAENSLAPHLLKVVQMAQKKERLKVRDVQHSIPTKNRPKAEIVRTWFGELAAMGRGVIQGMGRSIEFVVNFVEDVVKPSTNLSTAETIATQGIDPNCGHCGQKREKTEIDNRQEGKRQKAEGFMEEFEQGFNPAQFLATNSEIMVEDSDPCSLGVARTSALCPLPSPFQVEPSKNVNLEGGTIPPPAENIENLTTMTTNPQNAELVSDVIVDSATTTTSTTGDSATTNTSTDGSTTLSEPNTQPHAARFPMGSKVRKVYSNGEVCEGLVTGYAGNVIKFATAMGDIDICAPDNLQLIE
jgi:CRISPR-associated protein Cmr3